MIPPSYSVCRGQADQGIGEAGTPIKRGEQYLAADAPLQADPELLRGIRPWLTLDASPGDHGRLQERLTGWSCFPAGPYYFVVRLTAAGKYDRRDAYFAHARAWPLTACTGGFDPGLYLGQNAAFLTQAPLPGAAPALGDLPPPTEAPLAPALAHQDLAASLIAHLFHGMMTGYPVILGVPLTAFSATDPLARILAFARGALPERLRRRCRVRVFSRSPEAFLGSDPVDLLVIPEELSGPALGLVKRRALLLDARGERRDGPAPAAGLNDYAGAVIASAQRFPTHLSGFGERFDQLWPDTGTTPAPALTDWVTLTYNLAVALAGTEAHCGSLFANFLLAQARAKAQVPWPTLIRPQDWARFPQDHLIRFILRADDDLSAGERHLQAALVDAFQQRGARLDAGLAAWWNPAEGAKRRRLLELCDLAPPLITAARAAALTGPLTLTTLAADGGPLTGALRAEYQAGTLGARQAESTRLLAWLDQPGLLDLLLEAGQAGVLAPPWQSADLTALPLPQATTLARQLLGHPQRLDALEDLWPRLFARLRSAPGGLKAIAADLERTIEQNTAHLIQTGAWLAWRRSADGALDTAARRRLAVAWITSPALADLRDAGARVRPPQWRRRPDVPPHEPLVDVTRETWTQVMDDLGTLTPADLRLLTQPGTHWPWLHPFQEAQIRDLNVHCPDPEGRALLAAHLTPEAAPGGGWVAEVIEALAAGTIGSPALQRLRQQVQDAVARGEHRADTHPLIALLQALCDLPTPQRDRASPLIMHGWNTLQPVLATASASYDWAELDAGRPLLPLFHLAALLQPERQAGTLAYWLMYQPDCAPRRLEQRWWEALLGSVLEQTAPPGAREAARFRPRYELAEATRQAALGLIDAERDGLPEAESLALAAAWRALGIDRLWTDPIDPIDPHGETTGACDR